MLNYIRPVLHDNSEQELKDFTANITGSILQLPAGDLSFAIGVEHREQSGFYEPDAIYPARESAGVPSGPTDGEYDVDEVYGEIQIPILNDAPLADLLSVSAAIRWFDYSTFGSDTTTKFGLNWRPVDQLLVRATYGEGFRAPGIGELFGTLSRFDQTLDDPCSDYTAALPGGRTVPQPANIQANCATLGVPASYEQLNPQISVITGGNQELVPETADSYTVGLVWSPGFAQGASWSDALEFELTYYDISIDSTIQARDAQAKLDGCAATLDTVLCEGIERITGGFIAGFSNTLINIGGTDTSGYDLNMRWALPSTGLGQFTFSWQNTILDEYIDQVQTSAGLVDEAREGTERGSPSIAFPEWKSALTADWRLGDFGGAMTLRYTDSVTETCPSAVIGLGLCSNEAAAENEMDATTYVDLQGSWTPAGLGGGWTFTLGINNLLDEDPPFCFSCELNSFDGSAYDIPGMFWYGRVVARFGGPE
jgi:iron complex outermembrane receptor protein